MNYPTVLRELIECFKKLPGIGEKSAERLALATMKLDDQILEIFSDSIKNVKKKIKRCQKCNHFSENEICDICLDDSRNHNVICVVEENIMNALPTRAGFMKLHPSPPNSIFATMIAARSPMISSQIGIPTGTL